MAAFSPESNYLRSFPASRVSPRQGLRDFVLSLQSSTNLLPILRPPSLRRDLVLYRLSHYLRPVQLGKIAHSSLQIVRYSDVDGSHELSSLHVYTRS